VTGFLERFPHTIPLCCVFIFFRKNIIRWRDVKLCAFDNAKHRTYVDLKVKACDPFLLGNCSTVYAIM